jgi:hypothetical protein
VVALVAHAPMLGWLWLQVVALILAVLCWVARRRIQASEGALSGLRLTSWGMALTLFPALTYTAYYLGTYVAVQQQAFTFADSFLQTLQQGQVEKAYRLTIPPARRPADDDSLRGALEVAFNNDRDGEIPWSTFVHNELTRMFRYPGHKSEFVPLGVSDWSHDAKSYKVVLRYRLSNEEESNEYYIVAQGWDGAGEGDQGRRQWSVNARESRPVSKETQWSEEGLRRRPAWLDSQMAATGAVQMLKGHDVDDLWLRSLPVAEQATAATILPGLRLLAAPGVTGMAPLGAGNDRVRALALNLRSFYEGSLVRADPNVFYANERQRPEIESAVRALFSPQADVRPNDVNLAKYLPNWDEDDRKIRLIWGVQLEVPNRDPSKGPGWNVDGMLVLEADKPEPGKTPPFRITDRVMVSLQGLAVPESVISKLKPLKDKEFDREALLGALGSVLTPDELRRHQDLIVLHAGQAREWRLASLDLYSGRRAPPPSAVQPGSMRGRRAQR